MRRTVHGIATLLNMRRPQSPVAPVAYGIALSLAHGPLHPYAIAKELSVLGLGVDASRATVYREVERLYQRGWLEEVTSGYGNSRRRCFALTDAGRAAIAAESRRMQGLVALAESCGLTDHSRVGGEIG